MQIQIQDLQRALCAGLPGEQAHRKMAPITRLEFSEYIQLKNQAKLSAVNVILMNNTGQAQIILIQRPEYLGAHSGQISFPGGKIDPQDLSPLDAALRETQEEIGVIPTQINSLGLLTELYIPPSNFWIYPYLSYTDQLLEIKPDAKEVKEVFFLPLKELISPTNVSTFQYITPNGLKIKYPCFKYQNRIIWGATAMILQEVKELILKM